MSCSRVSVVPSQRSFPQAFVQRSSAAAESQVGMMDSIGHVTDRDLVLWPVGKERRKEVPADLPMQATHAIHRSAAADGQIGHVETLR